MGRESERLVELVLGVFKRKAKREVGDWLEVGGGKMSLIVNGFDGNNFRGEGERLVALIFESDSLNEGFVGLNDHF